MRSKSFFSRRKLKILTRHSRKDTREGGPIAHWWVMVGLMKIQSPSLIFLWKVRTRSSSLNQIPPLISSKAAKGHLSCFTIWCKKFDRNVTKVIIDSSSPYVSTGLSLIGEVQEVILRHMHCTQFDWRSTRSYLEAHALHIASTSCLKDIRDLSVLKDTI